MSRRILAWSIIVALAGGIAVAVVRRLGTHRAQPHTADAQQETFAVAIDADLATAAGTDLLSLDPAPLSTTDAATLRERGALFGGYRVLGRIRLSPDRVATIRAELVDMVREAAPPPAMACFDPRHGLLVHGDGKSDQEISICFECGNVRAAGRDHERWARMRPDAGVSTEWNALLTSARVPLAPR